MFNIKKINKLYILLKIKINNYNNIQFDLEIKILKEIDLHSKSFYIILRI